MRPLDSWQVLVSSWSSTNFRWKLMDKYCSFLMTGGKTERHVLCHLPEFSSRTEPQLPSVAICSLKRPILVSFPSLSLLATSLLVLSRIFSLITYLHMNLFSGSSFRGTQTERQILETSLLSSSWTWHWSLGGQPWPNGPSQCPFSPCGPWECPLFMNISVLIKFWVARN